jgi:16S rRNA (cytosine967-C5)-methyltransferase
MLLDFWIERLRSGGLDHGSRDLLRLGLYQLFCLGTPSHAAVFETVQLSGKRNRALINGVLRNAVRHGEELRTEAAAQPLSVQASHPEFLLERWRNGFGAAATDALAQWNNTPAPLYARVNSRRISVDDFVGAHAGAERIATRANFVRLAEVPHDALARGECYIQDPSTAAACELLDPQPGDSVLDACAAPGGKSGYIAELMQDRGRLVACDRDASRVTLLAQNLERLGLASATVVRHDWSLSSTPAELNAQSFDRILLDAPCTNTGVMRRRVDLRWRLRSDDFQRMPNEQLAIVGSLLPLLKPGGVFVYSTCSIEGDENELVAKRVLEMFPMLRLAEQRSVLPYRDGFDGAFAARFEL